MNAPGGRHHRPRPALCGQPRAGWRLAATHPRRRCVALLGPNGAGKSTLLRLLATAIRPSYGTAQVDGLDVGRDADLVRERVAYLSHASGLYDDLTARENLAFRRGDARHARSRRSVERALHDVGLAARADDRVGTFSAGMRRRLALGRILLGQASLVLLDEPTAALDADGFEIVEQLLEALARGRRQRPRRVPQRRSTRAVGRRARRARPGPRRRGERRRRDVDTAGDGRGAAADRGRPMTAVRRGTRIALAVARKDALAELRGRHATVSTLFFAAVVLLLFGFALGPDSARPAAAPGLLWLAIVLAGILAVGRLHQLETEDLALEQLAAYPVDGARSMRARHSVASR